MIDDTSWMEVTGNLWQQAVGGGEAQHAQPAIHLHWDSRTPL